MMYSKKLFRLAAAIALAAAATLQAVAAPAAKPAAGPAVPPQVAADMSAGYERLSKLLKEMPRDGFDPAAVVELAGRDPAALASWVRENTRLLPYRGALRGPAGVLLDRGGNSLDRSLLLAELLRDAGYEVRLASATLTDAQAAGLLAKLAAPAADGPAAAGPAVGGEVKQARDRVRAQADKLLAAIGDAPADLAAREQKAAAAALADHWWVQRKAAGDKWIDEDPSGLSGLTPARTLPFAGGTAALPVPKADHHEVQLRVVIEVFRGGKLQTETVLTKDLVGAELLGRSVVFSHFFGRQPGDPTPAGATDARQKLRNNVIAQRTYLPAVWVDGRAYTEAAFTTDGEVDRDPKMDPAGLLAAGSQKAMAGAFGGLTGDAGKAAPAGVLTAEWLEFEVRSPGLPPAVVRRDVFDLIGPAARAAGVKQAPTLDDATKFRRGLRLAGESQILVQPCDLTMAFLTYQSARAEAKDAAAWLAVAKGEVPVKDGVVRALDREAYRDETTPSFAVFRAGSAPRAGGTFIDRPNVIQYRQWLDEQPDGRLVARQVMDLAWTSTAAAPSAGGGPAAFRARVEQGVADTLAEHLVLGQAAIPGENTLAVFEASADKPATVVKPGEAAKLSALNLPPDAAARAAADLAAGNVLVVAPAAAGRWTWWRVDPATGQTVGVMDTGFHNATAEREAQLQAELNGYGRQIGRELTNSAVRRAKPGDIANWVLSGGDKVKNAQGVIQNLEGIQLELQTLFKQQAAIRGLAVF
ncbi:MAG TPA: hypothetical protein VF796_29795 [Humisphaera sp.]